MGRQGAWSRDPGGLPMGLRNVLMSRPMPTLRAYSLTITTLFLFACGDSGGKLTTGGPIIPGPVSSATNPSQGTTVEPTSTGGTTDLTDGGVTDSGTTDSDTTTGEPPAPTTGMVPQTTTNVTTAPMTGTTGTTSTTTGVEMTTLPPDETTTGSTSEGSGDPPDELCNGDMCAANESCIEVGDVPTCLAACDPLSVAACGADEMCAPL